MDIKKLPLATTKISTSLKYFAELQSEKDIVSEKRMKESEADS